jgi:regulator of sigma E protease
MSLVIFLLLLALLILVHELGHFSVAKFFGIKVEEFGIGFPPRLLYIKRGETTYSINLLFFGGFVKIFGENHNEAAGHPRSFAHKSRWIQAAVVVAGIVMNLLFAWGALSVGYMVGLPTSIENAGNEPLRDQKVTVIGLYPDSPAQKAGFLPGDTIVSIETATDKLEVATLNTNRQSDAVRNFISTHANESEVVTVQRDNEQKVFVAKPVDGLIEGRKALGVELDDIGILKLPPHLAVIEGGQFAYRMTIATAQGLGTFFLQIIRGAADFGSVAGPIGIAGIGAKAVSHGFADAVMLIALISINLAIINMLPIPGLDGGRLLLIAIEGVTRRPVPQRVSFAITAAGFAFLILIMVLVSYHDIARLIG